MLVLGALVVWMLHQQRTASGARQSQADQEVRRVMSEDAACSGGLASAGPGEIDRGKGPG